MSCDTTLSTALAHSFKTLLDEWREVLQNELGPPIWRTGRLVKQLQNTPNSSPSAKRQRSARCDAVSAKLVNGVALNGASRSELK